MIDPTTYGIGVLFAAWLDLAGWGVVIYGAGMVVGGLVAIVYLIVTWGGVTLGPDPVIPPVVQPQAFRPPSPKPRARREEADTHVIARIPGATPDQWVAQQRWIEAVDDATRELGEFTRVEGLRVIPHAEERIEEVPDEVLQRVRDGLRGPVCPTCGGPFGNCQCYSQKFATEPTPSPVREPDPLDVTQDIVVPFAEPAPAYQETFGKHPAAELGTQELSEKVAKILEATK